MINWSGVFPAVTTKVRADESLDLEATQASLARAIDAGVGESSYWACSAKTA